MPRSTLPAENCIFRLDSRLGFRQQFPMTFNDVGLSEDGFEFNGENGYIKCSHKLNKYEELTVEIDLNPDTIDSVSRIFNIGDILAASSTKGVEIAIDNSERLGFYSNGDNNNSDLLYTNLETSPITAHYVVTKTQQTVYINGEFYKQDDMDIGDFSTDYDLYIGTRINDAGQYYDGTIKHVSIYNRALTPQEISDRYNQVTFIDDAPTLTGSNEVIGISWDTSNSSPALTHINELGTSITEPDFDDHAVFGNIRRCVIDSTGNITYGSNPRGDDLILDGSAGNVMVEIPRFYTKFESDGVYRKWWISPVWKDGFQLHPAFRQRSGGIADYIYVSAYDAAGFDDSGTFKLQSATGKQPVTGGVSYTDLPNSGRFTIDDAELYANNIGSGYGCMNIWTMSAIRLLFYTEMGSLDSQSALGRGVVDLISGTGFAGVLTGAHSADTNIGTNGTGTGTGADGETPIVYRGIENIWGNVWTFNIGYNAVDSEYRITNRDGTGTLAGALAAGEYEASAAVPITNDGYGIDVATESLLSMLMIPDTVGGSTSTYLCDYFYAHDAGETNIMLSGGAWYDGSSAGIGFLNSSGVSSFSGRLFGSRFEFIPLGNYTRGKHFDTIQNRKFGRQ
jgi:hypothetical protein